MQLPAHVEHQQTEEVIDSGVCHHGQDNTDRLTDKRQFELRSISDVVDVIRLHRQRPAWVGDVRHHSHRHAEDRQNDNEDATESHYAVRKCDNYARRMRPADHHASLLRARRPRPVFCDHVYGRRDSFKVVTYF